MADETQADVQKCRRLTAPEQLLCLAAYCACVVWVVFCYCAYELISWFGRRV